MKYNVLAVKYLIIAIAYLHINNKHPIILPEIASIFLKKGSPKNTTRLWRFSTYISTLTVYLKKYESLLVNHQQMESFPWSET